MSPRLSLFVLLVTFASGSIVASHGAAATSVPETGLANRAVQTHAPRDPRRAVETYDGRVVKTEVGKLTYKDDKDKEQTIPVAADATIKRGDKPINLLDLKVGEKVKISIDERGGRTVAILIEADPS